MTPAYQLELWVQGISMHNTEADECCPDFSCCGGPLASFYERQTFQRLVQTDDTDTEWAMLHIFLGRLLAQEGMQDRVYIAGTV